LIICCGTYAAFKSRKVYTGPVLSSQTFSGEWNQVAGKINLLLEDINSAIDAERVIESIRSQSEEHGTNSRKQPLFASASKNMMVLIAIFTMVGFCSNMFFV
jgi:hypothetical protein